MRDIRLVLLRGVCQTPAYVAHEKGFLRDAGLVVKLEIAATAWMIPHQFARGLCDFAIMPWTRVAAGAARGEPMVVVAGSGIEEAAMVVRKDLAPGDVRSVSIPREGGIKDLTAVALIENLGWDGVEILRQPSGDGSIIALFGQGADAASMVEPYATMMEDLGIGRVIQRTGDVWKGAPGCSLTTSPALIQHEPDLVQAVVEAHLRAVNFARDFPDETAAIAAHYIGIHPRIIRHALSFNRPDANAVRNTNAMNHILDLMLRLGYVETKPDRYLDLRFMDRAAARAAGRLRV